MRVLSGQLLSNGLAFRCGLLEPLHLAMPPKEIAAHRVRVVPKKRCRIPDERRARDEIVVLHVPAAGLLTRGQSRQPFPEHLALAVRLAADRVVSKKKADREDLPAGKLDAMATRFR